MLKFFAGERQTDLPFACLSHFDSSRVHDNAFPFFPPDNGRMPSPDTKADYVRWTVDLAQPSGTKVADPQVLVATPAEFPR